MLAGAAGQCEMSGDVVPSHLHRPACLPDLHCNDNFPAVMNNIE